MIITKIRDFCGDRTVTMRVITRLSLMGSREIHHVSNTLASACVTPRVYRLQVYLYTIISFPRREYMSNIYIYIGLLIARSDTDLSVL